MKEDPKKGQLLQCVMQNTTESTWPLQQAQERLVSKSSKQASGSEKN